jgi:hypothetical protein
MVVVTSFALVASASATERSVERKQSDGKASYADAIRQFEGGVDPYVANPNSTATGAYQFAPDNADAHGRKPS